MKRKNHLWLVVAFYALVAFITYLLVLFGALKGNIIP